MVRIARVGCLRRGTDRAWRPCKPEPLCPWVRRIEPGTCADTGCGCDLASRPQVGANVVQVFDLPDVSLTVTQLELSRRRCACGKTTAAPPPFGISGPACYGPNVRSITALISKIGQVSVERTAVLMEMILAAPLSTGFVSSVDRRLHDLLDPFEPPPVMAPGHQHRPHPSHLSQA
jgi:hypothetical protein